MTEHHSDTEPLRGILGFVAVFLLAFTIRVYLLHPLLDAYDFIKYPALASILLQHGSHEPFNASPLYTYFWCLMHLSFDYTLFGPRIVQLAIGSLSAGLIYLVTLRVAPWIWALAAGAAAALYAPFIVHDGTFLSEFLVVFLNTMALIGFLKGRETGERRWWVVGGLCWGLSAICRPNILLLVPGLIAWAVWTRRGSYIARLCDPLISCGIAGLVVALIVVRNWRVSGDPVLVMSDGGIVFYIANNELDRGLSYVWPRSEPLFQLGQLDPTHRIARDAAQRSVGHPLSVSEASHFWLQQGLDFIRERPQQYLRLEARKLFYFWNDYEVPDTMSQYDKLARLRQWWWVRFGLIAPLAVIGMCVGWPMLESTGLLYAHVLVYAFTALAFGVESRYRLPVVPALIVFAVIGVRYFVGMIGRRRWGTVAAALTAVLVVGPVSHHRDFEINKADARMDVNERLFDPAAALVDKGRYAEAIPLLNRVVADGRVYEASIDAFALLRQSYEAMGDRQAAEQAFRNGIGPLCWEYADNSAPGDRSELAARLHQTPDDVFLLRDYGFACWSAHDFISAESAFRRVILLAPSHSPGHFNLAAALLAQGHTAEALHELILCLDLMPSMAPATALRAGILERQGKLSAAARDWLTAAHYLPENAYVQYRYGDNLLRSGRPSAAVAVLRKAAALAPGNGAYVLTLGKALAGSGDVAGAKTLYRSFLRAHSDARIVKALNALR